MLEIITGISVHSLATSVITEPTCRRLIEWALFCFSLGIHWVIQKRTTGCCKSQSCQILHKVV